MLFDFFGREKERRTMWRSSLVSLIIGLSLSPSPFPSQEFMHKLFLSSIGSHQPCCERIFVSSATFKSLMREPFQTWEPKCHWWPLLTSLESSKLFRIFALQTFKHEEGRRRRKRNIFHFLSSHAAHEHSLLPFPSFPQLALYRGLYGVESLQGGCRIRGIRL